MKEKGKEQGKEKTVVLNTRDLVLLFVFFVVVLMIVFAIGLLVGKNFTGEPMLAQKTPAADEGNAVKGGAEGNMPPIEEISLPPRSTQATPAGLPPSSEPVVKRTEPTPGPVTVPPPKTTSAPPKTATETAPKPAPPTPAPAPTPAPKPAATPAPAAGTQVTYIVQALATKDLAEARKMVDRLKAKGYDAFVKVAQPGAADQYHRVQVGRFRDMDHARELVARLKKDGIDAFPRKVLE
jgi:cell division septation protein DedD